MTSRSTVVPLRQPDEIDDPLTAVLRAGARRLLAQAIEVEADAFLASMKGERLLDGRERVVRHGHGPEHPRRGRGQCARTPDPCTTLAAVRAAALAQCRVTKVAFGIVLDRDACPVVNGVAQPNVRPIAHDDDARLAAPLLLIRLPCGGMASP